VRGLGVGLYIARELVMAHQGRIWVESTPGETTTFHVALPTRVAEQRVA
jgi:signal transduction histidine kinase